ncbi:response regulator transcription factor [Neptunomonas phycophila]|uniref:Response regulator transcription factor n=1 Tax=Neptunomonas phycophila TaxID=1572645 RepID=A0ABT9ETJ4_9GAMM|nr:response regulator transcription factor [Neptunomonas phycophila]MDP2522395.1 response regulator transcription factor [Neptunomonas phycophila]
MQLYKRFLIAEDHEMYRDGLKQLINELYPQAHIHTAGNFSAALDTLAGYSDWTLLMLDIRMPDIKNLDGLDFIRQRYPTLVITVISTLDFEVSIRQMIDLGANGFITKSTSKEAMKKAIIDILEGEIVILSETQGSDCVYFTAQQMATLQGMAQGLSNKEIARQLGVSPLTVKEYVSVILERLMAKNRTEAVLVAQKRGFLLDHLM